ncbi:MAG: hypothetical protein K1X28_02790 [Parachlamydiales bacterium]|nr:hypothetical protein [Parachlamydiales bacterium]
MNKYLLFAFLCLSCFACKGPNAVAGSESGWYGPGYYNGVYFDSEEEYNSWRPNNAYPGNDKMRDPGMGGRGSL